MGHVRDQVLNHVHVRQREDLDCLAGVRVYSAGRQGLVGGREFTSGICHDAYMTIIDIVNDYYKNL